MNLHAISYLNIGPFRDKTLSVFFGAGKYLIKAPIGSGKSFLFFDGPMYGLYKYSTRQMTNSFSKTGSIKLRFEVDGLHYFIIRELKKGASKDACTSKLYHIKEEFFSSVSVESYNKGEIAYEKDIEAMIKPYLEPVVFKNETDLQQTLNTILPPREVFVSTVFLMQDAENIFELVPAERLNVLKNVFGLLGIDEVKDRIAEKKRTLSTEIKIKSNTESYDQKLKNYLTLRLQHYEKIIQSLLFAEKNIDRKKEQVREITNLAEKIQLQHFSVDHLPLSLHTEIHEVVEQKKREYQHLQQSLLQTKKTLQEADQKTTQLTNEQKNIHRQQEELQQKIGAIDPANLKALKTQKQSLISEQETIQSSIPSQILQKFFLSHKDLERFQDRKGSGDFSGIETANNYIDHTIHTGKFLSETISSLGSQQKQLEQADAHLQEQLKTLDDPKLLEEKKLQAQKLLESEEKTLLTQQRSLQEKIVFENTQLDKLAEKIADFDKFVAEQEGFFCQKTDSSCPFIKQINKKTFDQFALQKQNLITEKQHFLEKIQTEKSTDKIKEIELEIQKIYTKKQEIENTPELTFQDFFAEIQHKKTLLQQKIDQAQTPQKLQGITQKTTTLQKIIDEIKLFLEEVERKKIKELYEKFSLVESQKRKLDGEIYQLEQEVNKLELYQQQLEKNKIELSHLEKTKSELSEMTKNLTADQQQLSQQIQGGHFDELTDLQHRNSILNQQSSHLKELIGDFKTNQIDLLKKQEEEKIINDLYYIFSKELLLLVLEDSLPTLTEIINAYLAQVVEYQISFFLSKSNAEKLELEARIYDDKGDREVKSLSGGQKVVLKLVWMLAISSYVGASMLFLDETINNLDQDTVGKVADMLEDFVKKRQIKLYTVTHSQQIQDMDIWDGVIGL